MEDKIRSAVAKCQNCGQRLGIDIAPPWRKTISVRCPICKKVNLVMTDKPDNCLLKLMEYEDIGMPPDQLLKFVEAARYAGLEPGECAGSVNYVCMPLKKNVPNPKNSDWKPSTCPECGRECWKIVSPAAAVSGDLPGLVYLCTECASRKGFRNNE